ncbi:hypothetical protein [Pedobacter glucosidilyticus]|uniref:hypothetical protein n=1 Tax=Pedobacter glucosidilyticus TaxID=1122941 RepID=UPI00041D4D26|nr:hypothetical protein [Pedobacter glucosidilyticus]
MGTSGTVSFLSVAFTATALGFKAGELLFLPRFLFISFKISSHNKPRLKGKVSSCSPTSHADDRKQPKSKVSHMKAVNFYCEMFYFVTIDAIYKCLKIKHSPTGFPAS